MANETPLFRKPRIEDYPRWLQYELKPDMMKTMRDDITSINDLLVVYEHRRKDPVSSVAFLSAVEIIRMEFRVWAMRERLIAATNDIEKLKSVVGSQSEAIRKLRSQIAALKEVK